MWRWFPYVTHSDLQVTFPGNIWISKEKWSVWEIFTPVPDTVPSTTPPQDYLISNSVFQVTAFGEDIQNIYRIWKCFANGKSWTNVKDHYYCYRQAVLNWDTPESYLLTIFYSNCHFSSFPKHIKLVWLLRSLHTTFVPFSGILCSFSSYNSQKHFLTFLNPITIFYFLYNKYYYLILCICLFIVLLPKS